jgi:hypothetical protein
LYKPLGKCHTNIDNNWKYYFSTTYNYICSTNNGKWIRHTPKRLAITQKFQLQGYSSDPPHLPFPAIPKVSQKAYICHHCSSSRQMQQANDKTQTHNFTEYLKAVQEPWEEHLLSDITKVACSNTTLAVNLLLSIRYYQAPTEETSIRGGYNPEK